MPENISPDFDFDAASGLPYWPELDAMPIIAVDTPPSVWKPLQHSMKRRCRHHNYQGPGHFMITVCIRDRSRWLLGSLSTAGKPHIEPSPLGYQIKKIAIPRITFNFPQIEVWNPMVMPDHIHMILHVRQRLDCHIGAVISKFKNECNDLYWSIYGKSEAGLFEEGYNDRLPKNYEAVKKMKKYILDNPRRLAIKIHRPELFTTIYGSKIGDYECQIYGNRYLLENPDKMAVVVHRSDDYAAFATKCRAWRACCERGGVLVGTAVAERERKVMHKAIEMGFPVIKLAYNGFKPLYKPREPWFDACAEGRFLEISPWAYKYEDERPSRERCKRLNALAEAMEKGEIL